jgi:hypothetical protein
VVHLQSPVAVGRGLVAPHAGPGGRWSTNHVVPENLVAHVPLPTPLQRAGSAWLWRGIARVYRQADAVTAPTPRAVDLLVAAGLPHAVPDSCGLDVERNRSA